VTGPWAVVATEEFEEWMMSLTEESKDSRWNDWYVDAIQRADNLFQEHIRKLGEKQHGHKKLL
jgi:hypothetical protein